MRPENRFDTNVEWKDAQDRWDETFDSAFKKLATFNYDLTAEERQVWEVVRKALEEAMPPELRGLGIREMLIVAVEKQRQKEAAALEGLKPPKTE